MEYFDYIVRLAAIEIKGIKNVFHGKIKMPYFNNDKDNNYPFGETLGIYGQNGSGKTALIDAMRIFKKIATCNRLWTNEYDLINVNSNKAELIYTFIIKHDKEEFLVKYGCDLYKQKMNIDPNASSENNKGVFMSKEALSVKKLKPSIESEVTLMEVNFLNETELVLPAIRNKEFISTIKSDNKDDTINNNSSVNILVNKKLCHMNSISFIFSDFVLNTFKDPYSNLIKRLRQYGLLDLFVVDQEKNSDMFINFTLRVKDEKKINIVNNLLVPYSGNANLPISLYDNLEKALPSINLIINSLLPDVKIEIKDIGDSLALDGVTKTKVFQLYSNHDGCLIPVHCESRGTIKIISVLSALISAFNNESVLVCVDEFDSGVFEYLFGQILKVFSESSKGQLIFTSHNLRPLEVLGRDSVVFTTNDKDDVYHSVLPNTRDSINYRSAYLRTIFLGNDKRDFYNTTNDSDIRHAFRVAGEAKIE